MEEQMNSLTTKICQAIWARRRGLAFCAIASLIFLILVSVVIGFCVPKETFYTQDVQIFLPKDGKGNYAYPNGQAFSPTDVISPAVLHKVYEGCQLQKKISYEDFARLFSFTSVIREKQFLDEKYAKALQRRNITGAEIELLEEKYAKELAKLDQGIFCLSFKTDLRIPAKTAEGIPLKVLETWKGIYGVQNGRVPQNALTSKMEKELNAEAKGSPLIAVDRAIYYKEQMQAFCLALKDVLGTRHLTLPETGESLDDIVSQLNYIRDCQLDILMQMILENQSLRGVRDNLFISGKIRNLERQLADVDGARKSIGEVFAQLEGGGTNSIAGRQGGGKTNGEAQLSFDASFFEKWASLIRSDIMKNFREARAQEYSEKGLEAARLKSDLEYYDNLKKQLAGGKVDSPKADAGLFANQFQAAVREMGQAAKQIEQFKALILDSEILGSQFYCPAGPTYVLQSAFIGKIKLASVAIVLWVLINFCAFLVASQSAFHSAKEKN